jgi:hypothetical protein
MIVRSLVRTAAAVAALGLSALAIPAFAQEMAAGETHVYPLAAQNGSGETGTVTLRAMGEKTMVIVALVNSTVPQPVHIHDGTCAKLDPKPKYPLTTTADGFSMTTVDAPMKTLIGGGFAVNAHESTTNIAKYVACGNLGK